MLVFETVHLFGLETAWQNVLCVEGFYCCTMTCAPMTTFLKWRNSKSAKWIFLNGTLELCILFLSSVKPIEPKVRFHGCAEETNFVWKHRLLQIAYSWSDSIRWIITLATLFSSISSYLTSTVWQCLVAYLYYFR